MSSFEQVDAKKVNELHELYGNDFLLIDIANARCYDKGNSYIKILFKSESGKYFIPLLKFKQKKVSSRFSNPDTRKYEALKLSLVQRNKEKNKDEDESLFEDDIEFFKACENINNAIKFQFENAMEEGKIKVLKVPKISKNKEVLNILSSELRLPLQSEYINDEGDEIAMDKRLWVMLPFKYLKPDETNQLKQFNGLVYSGDDKPFMIKEFNFKIKDLTKQKRIKVKGKLKTDCELAKVDNSNIHNFITPRSNITGLITFKITSSKSSFNVKPEFINTIYVEPGLSEKDEEIFEDDEMEDIFGAVKVSQPATNVDNNDNNDESDSDESDLDLDDE